MKYTQKTFSLGYGQSEAYRENYDAIFGKNRAKKEKDTEQQED